MRKNLAPKRTKRMMLMTKAMIAEMIGKLSRMMRKWLIRINDECADTN